VLEELDSLLVELVISTVMIGVLVVMHYVGLLALGRVLKLEMADERRHHIAPVSMKGIGYPVMLVIGLFALHGAQIWLYALLYLGVGAIDDLRVAVYFSTMTYATIGFGDHYIAPAWRVVAAIEGIAGAIMIGWSTAFFVTFVNKLMR